MPRRILLLITDLEIGGTPTVVRELAIRLNRGGGAVVEVACLKPPGPVAVQLRDAGVQVHSLGARSSRELLRVERDLRERIRSRGFDTVFSFLVHANVVAALAARKLPEVRFLQSIQTIQPRPAWHWHAQRWAARHAEKVVVPSTAIVKHASRASGIASEKFVVIPNAIEPSELPRVQVFSGPKVRAGYLGRLDPAKQPDVLVTALEFAAMEDAELHYFGDGPLRDWCLQMQQALPGRVFYHGAVQRPQDALSQIDVLWLPSWIEGFGLVLIEAMASGVPVVACEGGGVTDIVTHEQNGLLADDVAFAYRTFSAALWRLRNDAMLRNRLIENGLKTVRGRFTWEVILPQYQRLLGLAE